MWRTFIVVKRSLVYVTCLALWAGIVSCQKRSGTDQGVEEESEISVYKAPFELSEYSEPTVWGESRQVELDLAYSTAKRPGDEDNKCIRVSYDPGEKRWAGIFWRPRKEVGVRPEVSINGAKKISFWVRGETGDEWVEFKTAGEPSKELLLLAPPRKLSTDWEKMELNLEDGKIKGVTGLFGVKWRCLAESNPDGLTFYLDEIRYE